MKPTVIIRHCAGYKPETIRAIVREGLEELDLRPLGRTLVKPNLVMAGPLFAHAYTRPEFMEGVLLALRDRDQPHAMTELAVGERCGITVPTRSVFEQSGYNPMLKRLGVKRYCFEEEQQVEIQLSHAGRLRDYVYTPEPVAHADFFVNCPKFKAHPWTTVTFSMKSYIGIQDDRHRLIDHDHLLNEKVADLQHIIQPKFIAIDAITAGEGRMLTPAPFPLHLILMGNNQPAFDAVCCAIIGLNARDVEHIRLTSERGFGPIDLEQIELGGDVTLEEARHRARGFRAGLVRVERYFEGTNIHAYAGPPPPAEVEHSVPDHLTASKEYCWGGCPGAIEEAIEILRQYDEQTDEKMPPVHVVFGNYQGPIPARAGERVVFIGDCCRWRGDLHGKPVQIESMYQERQTKDPRQAKEKSLYARMVALLSKFATSRKEPYVRLEGCPVSISEQTLMLVSIAGLQNPYFDRREAWVFNKSYVASRAVQLWRRLGGRPYHRPGKVVPSPL